MSSFDAPQPPEECDLGILTAIGTELEQVLKAFGIGEKHRRQKGACYYWEASLHSQQTQKPLKVVIGCIADAGIVHAAIRTTSFLQCYRPTMMVLVGIAAGWRPKLQIGRVVWPRHVVAITATEVRKKPVFRTTTHKPPAAVAQMLHSWKVKDEDLASHTARIMGDMAVTGTDLQDVDGRKLVVHPPKAEECVIGSGDFLLRHDGHFVKLRKIDPQVCACEMECAGMVLALQTMVPSPAWLQIRGISDFGDSQKNDDWQPYAAAGASAFVRLFAEQCFDPVLISGKKPSPPTVTASAEQAIKPRAIATTVAVDALETAPAIPAGILPEFERIRDAWKRGRELQTLEKLQALRRSAAFGEATAETRAKILRFESKVVLDISHDVPAAEALVRQARELAGEHRASEALLLAHKDTPLAAADALAKPATLEEWNLRMGFLLQAKEADILLTEWAAPPEGVGPDAESYRLQTYALLVKKKVVEARIAFAKIGAKHRAGFAIRLAGAILDFYEAVSPAAPDRAFLLVPWPIPEGFIKRDEASLAALTRAEEAFTQLTQDVSEKNDFHYELQGWRLASAAMNTRRRREAEEICRQLLEERPTDVIFLGWADACEFQIDRKSKIDALAAELGVKL